MPKGDSNFDLINSLCVEMPKGISDFLLINSLGAEMPKGNLSFVWLSHWVWKCLRAIRIVLN
jgi:hypothetical protein